MSFKLTVEMVTHLVGTVELTNGGDRFPPPFLDFAGDQDHHFLQGEDPRPPFVLVRCGYLQCSPAVCSDVHKDVAVLPVVL